MFKKQFANISKGDVLNIDTLRTIVIECEAIINRRPITTVSTDSRDIEALTPMHFLAPAADHGPVEPIANTTKKEGETLKKSWERSQCRINGF